MNWLTPVVAGFLALAAWDGHRKGFLKKSVKILSVILTLAATYVLSPYIRLFLKEQTAMYRVLQNSIAASELDVMEALQLIGLEDMISEYLADMTLKVVAFLMTFLLVGVLVQGILFSLGIIAKLPVLHGLNKTAGMVLGFLVGILFVWIFFFVVTMCVGPQWGGIPKLSN